MELDFVRSNSRLFMIISLYSRGLITELIGRITMEKIEYQGVASVRPR